MQSRKSLQCSIPGNFLGGPLISEDLEKKTDFKGHFTKEVVLYQGGWSKKFVWGFYWGRNANAQIQKIRVF